MKVRYRLPLLALLIGLSTGCDQTTKRIAAETIKTSPPQSYAGDLFRLQYSENPGSFLSLGATLPEGLRSWVFIGGVGLFLAALLLFALFSGRLGPLPLAGIALILGGGAGNWIDRLLYGNVVIDFMNVGIGTLRSGIFNFADLFVIGGAILVAATLLPTTGRCTRA